MTREEFWIRWGDLGCLSDDYEKEFYTDLDKWFDAELKRNTVEMQKGLKDKTIRKQFIRLLWRFLKGESIESLEEEFGGENDSRISNCTTRKAISVSDYSRS